MLANDIRVTKQVEDATYDENLQRQAFIRVEFYIGKHGPFVERFPKADFSAATRDLKLEQFAMQIRTS
jgi:hypothetical protein